MTTRLSTVAPDLSGLVEIAGAAACRHAAVVAAVFAVHHSGLDDPRADEALLAIREGRFGDTPERAAVAALVSALDDRQWDLQDRIGAGESMINEHLVAFGRARAASAVFYAGETDPRLAAAEAIYEASAVVDDLKDLRPVVMPALI